MGRGTCEADEQAAEKAEFVGHSNGFRFVVQLKYEGLSAQPKKRHK